MTELYRYVVNSECLNNLAEVVRKIILLRNDELSVLYHCTEGKDRTGLVTALLLLTLGASKEDILKDYLYTNKVNRKKAIGYFLLVRIFKLKIKAARLVYGVFIARREYINELFEVYDAIGRKNFLKNYLKLTEEDIADFKERVLWE
jgi:protein-tyrosine phosphatase